MSFIDNIALTRYVQFSSILRNVEIICLTCKNMEFSYWKSCDIEDSIDSMWKRRGSGIFDLIGGIQGNLLVSKYFLYNAHRYWLIIVRIDYA